ncbi:MAG: hypothetical protein GEV10_02295 [Streptosporangiales bacterium]|nr:hypothetical protein [Streptosporangiales bacterium]
MDVSSLPLSIPRRTLRLFGQFWVPLITWYLVGRGLHDLIAEVAAHVNGINKVAGYALLSLAILCTLTSYVLMFVSVRRGLPTLWSLRQSEAAVDPTIKAPEREGLGELIRSIGLSLMPFLLVYSAWDLFMDDVRQLEYRGWELHPLGGAPSESTDFTWWFAGAGVVAWILVKIFEGITRKTLNPVTGLLAAVFESLWMFFGLLGVLKLGREFLGWLSGTLAWQNLVGTKDIFDGVGPMVPIHFHHLFTFDLGWFTPFQGAVKDGIILPIAWLAIAGAVYGRQMEDVRILLGDKQLGRVTKTLEKAPGVVKRWANRFPPDGFKEKYYPPLHAIRLMLAAGVPAALLFCVFYGGVELTGVLLKQGIVTIIGPHDSGMFWQEASGVLDVAIFAIIEPLRICLLAVTFDLAMSRFSARRNGSSAGSPDTTRESAAAPSPAP